ncbi:MULTISPECIES: multidrug transporter [Halolamina]|uniref:Uncharacterized protein n=1 Tax=Halolamina pelagica TaxID=699431 RepID=A0A1I5MDI3_9EURY|nr:MULTISPECIES: multidrug transporter [Halolamina]NHX35979.1 multidrug transporter [Halolamina sp. R1-12]SFP07579.1 hypothetical protein SAMN05216277_101220 [Halolamina pelagica]
MPGRSSTAPGLWLLGLVVAVVALVGTTQLGWEFGGFDDPVPIAIGVACAVLAAIAWLR